MLESFSNQLYYLQQFANELVNNQLHQVSIFSFLIIFVTGLITSLTPCMLSMLPLTIAYIGGYETKGRLSSFLQSAYFALGLATTLALLGVFAALLGRVYGQIGTGLPIFVSAIAILMGLNLLEIVPLKFPNWDASNWVKDNFPNSLKSYLLGLTFGLIASPCSTPVLITLLAFVASSENIFLSSLLLVSYAIGYVFPLILAGTFTGTLKSLLNLRVITQWINPISGGILLIFGIYSLGSYLIA
ncbi:cytochrome c biogenesis protein CcdA [Cyanobacterium aponinum AL20118]|uniref:Cytochrome c biogenesis protein CcdA n=1 Tax=Cyanobacterium aponinum AL20115 TaxID=3090662 RepID=A0AAF0ZFR8_9CHRO|nr:cytochrome c biogenesis protein CcdA [Cyanobacterium aponinum]MBD2395308.1 sulfite exporter TauE/SafE family protein [Cyanobacterium aponinum FACHB-4101]PHV62749.1 cytochrome C biogenesis protein [Cyanobacterium aponinum IPPAS B-1201]WPF90164.1 cytochrome c biogenesis protein CcdA [Cyanobacterium aponinum AL20115]